MALSGEADPTTVREMLAAGAIGYLVKGTPPSEFLEALRAMCGTMPQLIDPAAAAAEPDLPPGAAGSCSRSRTRARSTSSPTRSTAGVPGPRRARPDAVPRRQRRGPPRPDVAVVDATMPSGGGARIAAELASVSPAHARGRARPGPGDPGDALGLVRVGASSVVDAAGGAGEVVAAIERAARGGSSFEGGVAALVLENVREPRR